MNYAETRPERLRELIFRLRMNAAEFSDNIGIPRAETLYRVLNGHNNLSIAITDKIHNTYPDVNILWLLYGSGDMFQSKDDKEEIIELKRKNEILNEIVNRYERKNQGDSPLREDD
jgi:predicted transcriptional regulator